MNDYGFLSLVPPLLTIAVSLYSKNVLLALATGIFSGSLIMTNYNPFYRRRRQVEDDRRSHPPARRVPRQGEQRQGARERAQGHVGALRPRHVLARAEAEVLLVREGRDHRRDGKLGERRVAAQRADQGDGGDQGEGSHARDRRVRAHRLPAPAPDDRRADPRPRRDRVGAARRLRAARRNGRMLRTLSAL